MDCILFTFKDRVPLMRMGASAVWHLSLPPLNSFNKTEAVVYHAGYASWGLSLIAV